MSIPHWMHEKPVKCTEIGNFLYDISGTKGYWKGFYRNRKNFTETSKKFTKISQHSTILKTIKKHPTRYRIPLTMGSITTTFSVLLFDSFVFDGF
jgi:hypothetical protein